MPWHVITPEYPPAFGGVSDYTYLLAQALAASGDEVHLWCPDLPGSPPSLPGTQVHEVFGRFSPARLWRAGRELDSAGPVRRLLVQWVPHGFGCRSLNVPFCLWLYCRTRLRGDRVELMVHEPFLPFRRSRWRQNAAAAVHRLMTIILLRAAGAVWVSTPVWEQKLRPYALGRPISFGWLPVPSNIPVVEDPAGIRAIRARYAPATTLIGHFGTFGPLITPMLESILPSLARKVPGAALLLLGAGSEGFRARLLRDFSGLDTHVYALGNLDPAALSLHLSACDIMVQPYPDGVTSRRGSMMAALSHGRAIVTTEGELTEPVWRNSRAAILVPPKDAEAFVDSVLALAQNAEHRERIGAAAHDLYMTQFDIHRTASALRRSSQAPLR